MNVVSQLQPGPETRVNTSNENESNIRSKRSSIFHTLDIEDRRLHIVDAIKRFDFQELSNIFREAMQGMEDNEPEIRNKLDYQGTWGLPTKDAERCLYDRKRTELFKAAIESIVKSGDVVLEVNVSPGDVVVEAGAGTGILALIAAAQGAKKVYAVEINPNTVKVCKQFIEFCGFHNVIEVINGDATKFVPPEKVDVIMSENMYTGLLEEPQQQIMNNLLFHLNSGGRVIPKRLESFIELISAPKSDKKSKVKREIPGEIRVASAPIKYDDVQFDKQERLDLDTNVTITATESTIINAVNISSLIYLTEDIIIERDACDFLGNDEVIYLDEPTYVEKGGNYKVHIKYNGGDKAEDVLIEIEAL